MQYTAQVPSYFHERDKGSRDFSQHIFNGKGNFVDQRGYNMFAQKSSVHQYLGYDKETIRQIMHYQDETFRFQVRELHRLYKRQRELMDDITMRQIFIRDLQYQTLKSDVQCLPQVQPKDEEKLSLTSIMGDSEIGSLKTRDSSGCQNKLKFFIDLNESLMPEPEPLTSSSAGSFCLMGIVQHNQHAREEAKSESAVGKHCGRVDYDIDLNTMPSNFPSESAVKDENNDHRYSKANSLIDLNVNGENQSESPLNPNNNRRSCPRIISENVPHEPRREGEMIQELDRIAAETLVSILSSAQITMDLKNRRDSLSWFADVVSSVGDDDQEGKVHDQSRLIISDRTEDDNGIKQSELVKRKSRYPFCVVRNETQSGTQPHKSKRVAARDMRQDTRMIEGLKETGSLRRNSSSNLRKHAKLSGSYEVRTSTSSLVKQLGIRSKQCVLHDWGKIKKRQRGFRRRSKYQVMT